MQEDYQKELYIDFDESMGKGTGYYRIIQDYDPQALEAFYSFKSVYEQNNLLKVKFQKKPKIPKIIHQVWIGNNKMIPKCEKYRESWKKHHPGWEYRLWTDEEVRDYKFIDSNLETLFKKSSKIGEKVDIIRYDILTRYGGLYIDVDTKCLRPFDVLHHCYDFYAGLFNPIPQRLLKEGTHICNAAFGASPGHPILKKISELLVERWENVDIPEDEIYSTVQRTYTVLTDAFLTCCNHDHLANIALPSTYFYPIMNFKVLDLWIRGLKENMLDWRGPYNRVRDHSFMFHDSQRQWFVDGYESVTFRGKAWLAFKGKDWLRWAKAKLSKYFKKTKNRAPNISN